MRVHHISVASMCPPAARLVNEHGRMVAHALLVELSTGLALIETGVGTAEIDDPSRLGVARWFAGFRFDRSETAVSRIESLGHSVKDVRHILCTHLDLDHAGGLPDFPDAEVHVHEDELAAALHPHGRHRLRYVPAHLAHPQRFRTAKPGGERWFGFEAVRDLPGLPPEILMIPLPGHSPGHCGIAVNRGDKWLLHCGDAYFHHSEVRGGRGTPGLALFQMWTDHDRRVRLANQARLSELIRDHAEVEVFCAHDPTEFGRACGATS